ncbi:unnamed protein product [Pylaiella littoralis]
MLYRGWEPQIYNTRPWWPHRTSGENFPHRPAFFVSRGLSFLFWWNQEQQDLALTNGGDGQKLRKASIFMLPIPTCGSGIAMTHGLRPHKYLCHCSTLLTPFYPGFTRSKCCAFVVRVCLETPESWGRV